MQKQTVSSNGVHVAGRLQGSTDALNPANLRMYSFDGSIYQYQLFVTAGTYEYKYYNGNTVSTAETVPSSCASNENRVGTVSSDLVLSTVCFSSCSDCSTTAVKSTKLAGTFTIYPSVIEESAMINLNINAAPYTLTVTDTSGKIQRIYSSVGEGSFSIQKGNLCSGLYIADIYDKDGDRAGSCRFIVK
jgi:hypothetical protein